jgi:hypothetical protein
MNDFAVDNGNARQTADSPQRHKGHKGKDKERQNGSGRALAFHHLFGFLRVL